MKILKSFSVLVLPLMAGIYLSSCDDDIPGTDCIERGQEGVITHCEATGDQYAPCYVLCTENSDNSFRISNPEDLGFTLDPGESKEVRVVHNPHGLDTQDIKCECEGSNDCMDSVTPQTEVKCASVATTPF